MVSSNYKEWFLRYVDNYGNIPEIIMKRDHSIRVENNMVNIFKKLGLSKDYLYLADFIGLFHDIGRFEQWKRYHTYVDSKSIDHADFSANLLLKEGLLKEIINDRMFDNIIYDAIKYHNKLSLPEYLSIKDEQLFNSGKSLIDYMENYDNNLDDYNGIASLYAMSIRDTDKIDIYNQYLLSNYLFSESSLEVSSKVEDSFFENKSICRKDVKNINDSMVLRLSFINDINLTKSLVLIKNNDFLRKIYDVFPNKDQVSKYFDYAENRLNYLLEKNNSYQYVIKK